MFRALYAICLIGLIGSTAWAATGLKPERQQMGSGVGLVLLVALQR
jgi:hypothetical protein